MHDPSWTSLLPPVVAIGLALWTRQVYLSLAGGIWLGCTLLAGGHPGIGLGATIDRLIAVLGSEGDARVIVFTLVIGALLVTLEASGGVAGFVAWLERRRWVGDARRAQLLAWALGVVIFVESNITVLVAGAVSRPLFDRYRCSREKLAYIIDSTSAPICILIPLNAWGAYNLALLDGLGIASPLPVFLGSIPYNVYAWSAVLVALLSIVLGFEIGPMRAAQRRAAEGVLHRDGSEPSLGEELTRPDPSITIPPRARNMVVPIAVMVLAMPVGLWITGEGDMLAGSGSKSVLWAVLVALAVAWGMLLVQRAVGVAKLTAVGLRGAGALLPLALILVLALALGGVARELGTGDYVASWVVRQLPPVVFLPAVFVVGAGVAFAIGSSWGTFAIMLPIAVPAAEALGLPLAPFVAASLSGGVFGDHASPISDTTIVASMAAATDHVEHVRTQLPYALLSGAVSIVAFAAIGATL